MCYRAFKEKPRILMGIPKSPFGVVDIAFLTIANIE